MKNQNNKTGISIAIIITLVIVNVYEFFSGYTVTHIAQNSKFFRAWADAYYEISFNNMPLFKIWTFAPIIITIIATVAAWIFCKKFLRNKTLLYLTVSTAARSIIIIMSFFYRGEITIFYVYLAACAIWLICFAVSVVLMIIDMIKYVRNRQ